MKSSSVVHKDINGVVMERGSLFFSIAWPYGCFVSKIRRGGYHSHA